MHLPFRPYSDILILKKTGMVPQGHFPLRERWQGLQHGLVCFCLGGAGLYLCASGQVGWMLAPKFFPWLAWGSVILMTISGFALGRSLFSLLRPLMAKRNHAESCFTRHPNSTNECLLVFFSPVRFALLSFPLGLVLLGMPSQGLASVTALDLQLFQTRTMESKGFVKVPSFNALMLAAQSPAGRESYEGMEVFLTGRIVGIQSDRFTLIRFRMNCCAADAYAMRAGVLVEGTSNSSVFTREWERKLVRIRGQLQFHQDKDQTWLPILVIPPITTENPLKDWVQDLTSDPGTLYEFS